MQKYTLANSPSQDIHDGYSVPVGFMFTNSFNARNNLMT